MQARIIKAELLSFYYSSLFRVFAILVVAIISLSVYSAGAAQSVTPENAQIYVMKILDSGSVASLFVAFVGISLFTKEFGKGQIIRSVIYAGNIRNVAKNKFLVSGIIGFLFGLISSLLTLVGLEIWLADKHITFIWNSSALIFILRVFFSVFLSALWGTSIGWVGRNEKTTSWAFIFYRMLFVPIVIVIFPALDSWLPGFTLNFRNLNDGTNGTKLLLGITAFIGWILLGFSIGVARERKKGYL